MEEDCFFLFKSGYLPVVFHFFAEHEYGEVLLEKGLFFMHIFTAYHWEKGSKTERNQDSLALCQMVVRRKRCLMAVVCDGIGSIPNAEKASGYVTEQLVNWFYHRGPKIFYKRRSSKTMQNAMKREIYHIREDFQKLTERQGCTLSLLLVVDRRYFLCNVGDSRIYLGRRKKVKLLSVDDVYHGMLTNCIGNFSRKDVLFRKGKLRKDDTFLVCSDGFYKRLSCGELDAMLTGERICRERQAWKMLQEAGRRIRAKGETDDVSAVYVKMAKEK